jgi:hypothetical protein
MERSMTNTEKREELQALADALGMWTKTMRLAGQDDGVTEGMDKAAAALREYAGMMDQEPVAWRHIWTPGKLGFDAAWTYTENKPSANDSLGTDWFPLYTHPPQRVPLTEAEITEIVVRTGYYMTGYYMLFARALEAAHGIVETK